jgi:hypothetical protein
MATTMINQRSLMKNVHITSNSFQLAHKFRAARAKLDALITYFYYRPIRCYLFFFMLMAGVIGFVVLLLTYFPDHWTLIMFGGIVAITCVMYLANEADFQSENAIHRNRSGKAISFLRNAGMAGVYGSVGSALLDDDEHFGNPLYKADFDSYGINPATGLPMIDSALDVGGNAFCFGDGDIGLSSFDSDAFNSFSDFDSDSNSGFSSFDSDSSLFESSWED